MSGLLVKSTVVMRENMLEMTRQGLDLPVMLGGAALTRQYVEEDCVQAYASGRVAYARDAFDGLHLMDRIVSGGFETYLAERQAKQQARPKRRKTSRIARRGQWRGGRAAPGRARGDPAAPQRAVPRHRGPGAAVLGPAAGRARCRSRRWCPT